MDLNIRNVPEELMKKLKVDAASIGITLRDHCLGLLELRPLHVRAVERKAEHSVEILTSGTPVTPVTSVMQETQQAPPETQQPVTPVTLPPQVQWNGEGIIANGYLGAHSHNRKHHGFKKADGYWCVECQKIYS